MKNKLLKTFSILISACLVIICFSVVTLAESTNLLSDPGFETTKWANPTNEAKLWTLDTQEKHSGNSSLKAFSKTGSYDLSVSQYVSVDFSKSYLYTIWIKTEGLSQGTAVHIKMRECKAQSNTGASWYPNDSAANCQNIITDSDWTRYKVLVKGLKSTTKFLKIYCEVTKGGTPGTVWFDDASLIEYDTSSMAEPVTSSLENNTVLNEATSVTLSTETENALIYYTTDDQAPSVNSNLYTSPITIDKTTVLKAIAIGDVGEASDISTFKYYYYPEGEIIFNGGFENETLEESFHSDTENSFVITTDDKASGDKSIVTNGDGTVQKLSQDKAFIYKGSYRVSAKIKLINIQFDETATEEDKCSAVGFYPMTSSYGVYANPSESGWQDLSYEFYQANNNYSVIPYIRIDDSVISGTIYFDDVSVKRVSDDASEQVRNVYYSPKDKKIIDGDLITLTTGTDGAKIYYTTDLSTPTEQSNLYNAPFSLNGNTTIKAIAIKDGMTNSKLSVYSINVYPKDITTNISVGRVDLGTGVTLSCATENAQIYYTTDLSEPTTNSTLFDTQSPILIDGEKLIKAIAVKDGYTIGDIQTFYYTSELVLNGGFECGDWKNTTVLSDANAEIITDDVYDGNASLKITGKSYSLYQYIPVDFNYVYTFKIHTKLLGTTNPMYLKVKECVNTSNSNEVWYGKEDMQKQTPNDTNALVVINQNEEWTEYSVNLRALKSTTKFIKINIYGDATDGTVLLDNISVEKKSLFGDANNDGVLDIRDLINVEKNVGLTTNKNADVSDDGEINAEDLVYVKKLLLKR